MFREGENESEELNILILQIRGIFRWITIAQYQDECGTTLFNARHRRWYTLVL